MISRAQRAWSLVAVVCTVVPLATGCSSQSDQQNSLKQITGESGSTMPRSQGYYPNTSGNIVAPPGNPAGNAAGSPPIVGGTASQQTAWPDGR